MPERILVVDDVVTNVQLLAQALEPAGYEILVAQNGRDALRIAERAQPGLILMDVMMPGLDGVATCRLLKQNPELADIPVIFITALDERESVVKGFTAGGVDYIVKPFHPEEVLRRVENHLNLHRLARSLEQSNRELKLRLAELERANRALAEERDKLARTEYALETADSRLNALAQREQQRWGMDGLVGKSATMQAILQNIRKLHHSAGTSVLITGESGTGKELIARAIHYSSPRAQKPFIPVNCVAIPAELAESMFFGHVKGAFTGASGGQKGFFELADGGTLFLDEIGDMPLGLQAKLLRVLEDGEVRPVGSQKAIKPTCAWWPPPTSICRKKSPPDYFALICFTAWRASRWSCRHCASDAAIFFCLRSIFSLCSPGRWACAPRISMRRRRRRCRIIISPAMCAS